MIQFGFSIGFSGFHSHAPQQTSAPQELASNTHTVNNPSTAPGPMSMSQPMMMTMMTPAYMMAYPQMMSPMGMAPSAGMGGVAPNMGAPNMGATNMGATNMGAPNMGGANADGHVTANPTNSVASAALPSASGGFGGFGGFGGVGTFGGFAMPVMMLSPVFFQMGYPMVFQGSQAQPPLAGQPPVVAEEPTPAPIDIPDPIAAPPVNTDGVSIDVVPPAVEPPLTLPSLPITELGAEDFAKYRLVEKSKQQETSLSLQLLTQDGDKITLDFSQLDVMEMSRFRGKTLDGERLTDSSYREDTQRVVNMDVVGDLSDAEKIAVDEVLSTIVQAVQQFFTGNVGQAVAKLKAMDFDGQQLSELSLNMSMSKSANVTKAFHNGEDRLHDLKNRDADVNQALEFLASEQKRLIDVAKGVFDAPSAAGLIRSLVPPLLADPFAQLEQQIETQPGPVLEVDSPPQDTEEL